MADVPAGGPDVVRLRAHARRLRTYLDDPAVKDAAAYARLVHDGERQPWTAAALHAWEEDGGVWRVHHLAVAHHARAYDLEAAGDPAALDHWAAALEHWAALYADDAFWTRSARHLAAVMPHDDVAPAVDRVRARLPRDLLAPHLTRATELRETDPERARAHVDLIRRAHFGADVADRARADLVRGAVRNATAAADGGAYDGAVSDLGAWLRIDPANPGLIRALLVVASAWLESLAINEDWGDRARPVMRTVDELLKPYSDERREAVPGRELAPELARYAYWHGRRLMETEAANGRAAAIAAPTLRAAIRHFERARRLDPGLGFRVDALHAKALAMAAAHAVRSDPEEARRHAAAIAGIEDAHWSVRAVGAQALLSLRTESDKATARTLLDRAAAEITSASPEDHAWLARLRAGADPPGGAAAFGLAPKPEQGPPVPMPREPAGTPEVPLRCAVGREVLEWIADHVPFDRAEAARAHALIDAVGEEQAAEPWWPRDAAVLHRFVDAATTKEGDGT